MLMNIKSEQVKAFFNSKGDNYLRHKFAISIRRIIVNEIIGKINNSKILDIGCGNGAISFQFLSESNHVTFVDISRQMLDRCEQNIPDHLKVNANLVCADIKEFTPGNKYDLILCIGVLAHIADLQEAIMKISSLLKIGGRCIFQITDSNKLISKCLIAYFNFKEIIFNDYKYTLNRVDLSHLYSLTSKYGLAVVGERRYCQPFPGMRRVFSDNFLFAYELYTMKKRLLSKYGSEVIILFTKAF